MSLWRRASCAQTGQLACLLLDRWDLFPEALQTLAFLLVVCQIRTAGDKAAVGLQQGVGSCAPAGKSRGWAAVPRPEEPSQHRPSLAQVSLLSLLLLCVTAAYLEYLDCCVLSPHPLLPPGGDRERLCLQSSPSTRFSGSPAPTLPCPEAGRGRRM